MRWTLGCVMGLGCTAEPDVGGPKSVAEGELDGVQVGGAGEPAVDCGVETVTEVGLADIVLDGHSAEQALSFVGAEPVQGATWFDGRDSTLTATIAPIGDTATVTEYSGFECADHLVFPATLSMASDDGALAEHWDADLRYQAPWTGISSFVQIPVGELVGTLDASSILQAAEHLDVVVAFEAGGSTGTVSLSLEAVDPTGTAEPGYVSGEVVRWDERP
jgi:hypothetical protein